MNTYPKMISRDLEVSERYSFDDFPKYITKFIATLVKHVPDDKNFYAQFFFAMCRKP